MAQSFAEIGDPEPSTQGQNRTAQDYTKPNMPSQDDAAQGHAKPGIQGQDQMAQDHSKPDILGRDNTAQGDTGPRIQGQDDAAQGHAEPSIQSQFYNLAAAVELLEHFVKNCNSMAIWGICPVVDAMQYIQRASESDTAGVNNARVEEALQSIYDIEDAPFARQFK